MSLDKIYIEHLRLVTEKLNELKSYIKSEEPKGLLKLGADREQGFEFFLGLRRFFVTPSVKLRSTPPFNYYIKTYEVVLSESNFGFYKLNEVPDFVIEGDFDGAMFSKKKTTSVLGRVFDLTYLTKFGNEYIGQLVKTIQEMES